MRPPTNSSFVAAVRLFGVPIQIYRINNTRTVSAVVAVAGIDDWEPRAPKEKQAERAVRAWLGAGGVFIPAHRRLKRADWEAVFDLYLRGLEIPSIPRVITNQWLSGEEPAPIERKIR